jgi:hypothetical protein
MKNTNLLNKIKISLLITAGIFALIVFKKVNASKGSPEDHIVNETGFTAIDFATGAILLLQNQ